MPETGILVTAVNIMVNCKHQVCHTRSEISFQPWSKPQTCKTSKSESLVFGWESKVAELLMTVCCQVSLCCEIRFVTMEKAGEREILVGSA